MNIKEDSFVEITVKIQLSKTGFESIDDMVDCVTLDVEEMLRGYQEDPNFYIDEIKEFFWST